MFRSILCTALVFFPVFALAQDLASKRPEFMAACNEQGTEERFCACFFDNWASTVAEGGVPAAMVAIDLFAGKAPENPADIVAGAQAMASLQETVLACVSGQIIPLQEAGYLPPIEQTGDQAELDQLAARLQSGQSTMEEMFRHDALTLELREQAKAAEAAANAARGARAAENRAALRSDYDNELQRIHRQEIEAWEVGDFEPLFGLYCQMEGGRPQECACGWDVALRWANGRQNFVYLASRGPGDDVTERVNLFVFQAITNTGLPGMREDIAQECHED